MERGWESSGWQSSVVSLQSSATPPVFGHPSQTAAPCLCYKHNLNAIQSGFRTDGAPAGLLVSRGDSKDAQWLIDAMKSPVRSGPTQKRIA